MSLRHGVETLLTSYNRQCPDCRRTIAAISERRARGLLAQEAVRTPVSRIRLQNSVAIWQSAAKRANAKGKS